jgi:hypothetical protein
MGGKVMEPELPIVLQPSVWDTDNLGDLIAEGELHIDDLSLRAVAEQQREELLLLSQEWDKKMEDYWNSIDWEDLKAQSELATESESVF